MSWYKKEKEPNKIEAFYRANELYQRCLMWSMKHDRQRPKNELSESEAELQDIAQALHQLMVGKDPFKAMRKDHLLDLPEDWINRMGVLLLTGNKKKVSESFDFPDDSSTLNQYIAVRASDFLYEEELEGLSASQKTNRLIELLNQYPDMKDHYIGVFETHFDAWLADKQAVDVAYKTIPVMNGLQWLLKSNE